MNDGGSGNDGAARGPTGAAVCAPPAHRVEDDGTGLSFDVRPGESILDAALSQGVELAHGCGHGVCGACAVEIVDGLDNLAAPDAIERNSIGRFRLPKTVRLACRTCVSGPVRIRPAD